ncbi:hypothetical protein [Streptomyces sp. NPDC015350]|uniref:hypothetical protein n=1 Tax=Streptomyces sp. NPDC015350 TaxID=3364955 RepID=UPI0036F6C3EF
MPDPALWDLAGAGQVPRTLLPALHDLAHIDLVDVNQTMLEAALTALDPVREACTVDVFTSAAHTFTPYRRRAGPSAGWPARRLWRWPTECPYRTPSWRS